MVDFTKSLEKIGLSKKEALVYLALLRTGQASASLVSKNAGLKRSTTYLILEDLRKQGFVLKMPGNKKQMFTAKSPKEIVGQARENVDHTIQILPQLMLMFNKNDSQIKTVHFEGIHGIREALWYKLDELAESEITAFFGSAENASTDLVDLFHEWNSVLPHLHIKLRSVAPDIKNLNAFRENDKKHGFRSKIIPQSNYTSKTSIDITSKFIRIIMIKEQQAVIVENLDVSKAMKEIFEIVWNQ